MPTDPAPRQPITCPSCQTPGSVRRDLLGRTIRCKQCGNTFVATNAKQFNAADAVEELAANVLRGRRL